MKKISKTKKYILSIIIVLLMGTLVRAALLPHYGGVTVHGNITQAIVFDGEEDNTLVEHELNPVAGSCKCYKEIIKNRAPKDGGVTFETSFDPPEDEGITVTIYQVPKYTTLELNNKDSNWEEINDDGISGTLIFQTMKTNFDYKLTAEGLIPDTEYSLIYYADPWAGNHPGAHIWTYVSDQNGEINVEDHINLGMNMPQEEDENHLDGAKIWLVLADDYDPLTHEMINWNMGLYLFEHELVAYSDCDKPVACWLAPLLGTPITDVLIVPAETQLQLIFCYDFAINMAGQPFSVQTLAIPMEI